MKTHIFLCYLLHMIFYRKVWLKHKRLNDFFENRIFLKISKMQVKLKRAVIRKYIVGTRFVQRNNTSNLHLVRHCPGCN